MTMPDQASWSYDPANLNALLADGQTPNPTYSALSEVRYLLQDTDPNVRYLADFEVNYAISQWIGQLDSGNNWQNGPYDHPLMAAHGCALRIAAKFAGVTSIAADGVTVDVGDLQGRYTALAQALQDEYDKLSESGASIDIGPLLAGTGYDWSIKPTWAAIGGMDNPEAGAQNYGGIYGGWNENVEDGVQLETNASSP